MYTETIERFADIAVAKAKLLRQRPAGFFISAMMAGAYVGLGIILIFTLGNEIDPAWRKLVMGTSFGIALTLVVFAGSDLFTGLTMYMTQGSLTGRTGWRDLVGVWVMSWVGNLVGSVLLALLFAQAGGGALLFGKSTFLFDTAAAKMAAPAAALFARAVLCNWLVCLSLWMAARMTSDSAKCIAIFWCLFAFIACGYEHSVANMTLLTLALIGNHPDTISIAGMVHNLIWVSLGNIVSGAGFMGVAYWYVSQPAAAAVPVLVESEANA
ncbi:MAG TPA: nitrite transporter NirC [Rhodopila sp.]